MHAPRDGGERRHSLHAVRAVDRRSAKPAPLVVALHGLNITPLQQILFDGTTDFAERYGFIVLAPMGFNLSSWWGSRTGTPVATAAVKPGGDVRYSTTELAEIDTMALLKSIREQYAVDSDRIYLMGHSMGGAGTYYLGRGVQRHLGRTRPTLRRWGHRRRRRGAVQVTAGARHARREGLDCASGEFAPGRGRAAGRRCTPHRSQIPEKDHEFWIRRGAAQMEKVFLFFSLVSKRTTVLPQK